MLATGISAVMLPSCSDTDLYETDAPEWISQKVDSIAAAKAANEGGEEEAPGLVIDLTKYADDFVFNGDAEMVTSDVLLIETGAGGKNKNFVRLKEDGWLKDKITFTNVATISFDAYPTVNGSDWNYVFAIGNTKKSVAVTDGGAYAYFDGTIGFIQRVGDPYEGFFPGGCWADGNQFGGTADNNPYNYFSGLDESNCNKWWHFDYIYSTTELSIYVNGVKAITHPLSTDQGNAVKNILATLNEGQLIIGAGCEEGDLENFGGYIANFTLRNEEYVKTSNFFSGEVTPKESEIKSLTVTGPESVPFGTTYDKLLEQVSIKVTYEIDGEEREKELSTSDVIINLIPDMSTVGKKTLSVYYNTTYAGKFQKNVKSELVFEVVNSSLTAIKVKTNPTKMEYNTGDDFDCAGIEVVGMEGETESNAISTKDLDFEYDFSKSGSVDVTIKYLTYSTTLTVSVVNTNPRYDIRNTEIITTGDDVREIVKFEFASEAQVNFYQLCAVGTWKTSFNGGEIQTGNGVAWWDAANVNLTATPLAPADGETLVYKTKSTNAAGEYVACVVEGNNGTDYLDWNCTNDSWGALLDNATINTYKSQGDAFVGFTTPGNILEVVISRSGSTYTVTCYEITVQ